ncbi:thermonuclease family protein [Rubritalea marina]|uniref:thermonuclease family protein n=1 Tax=Rubritalea marina TaxID=361055 RepID=UPI00037BA2AA|nr:thermonuclease family protein [Rubritalea marina]
MDLLKRSILLSLLSIFITQLQAVELSGIVTKVADGDSITLTSKRGKTLKIRLAGIDAPEKNQDYGTEATQALQNKLVGKQIIAKSNTRDRYGRYVATLYLNGENINAWMLSQGLAWHYTKYSKSEELKALERDARSKKIGLWNETRIPIAPWQFRSLRIQTITLEKAENSQTSTQRYWLNTSSNVRHNSSCEWFRSTKRGRSCRKNEGSPCGQCGG